MKTRAIFRLVTATSLSLSACATLKQAGSSSAALAKKSTTGAVSKITSIHMPALPSMPNFRLANLLPGSDVKVVDVRQKDLKDLPTGKERALAYENERKKDFWSFSGPVDFKEPKLPEPGGELDGSLLPPRLP